MVATKEQKEIEKATFTGIWNLYLDFYNPEQSDQYWDDLTETSSKLSKSLQSETADKLILSILGILQERGKSNEKHKRTQEKRQ